MKAIVFVLALVLGALIIGAIIGVLGAWIGITQWLTAIFGMIGGGLWGYWLHNIYEDLES